MCLYMDGIHHFLAQRDATTQPTILKNLFPPPQ